MCCCPSKSTKYLYCTIHGCLTFQHTCQYAVGWTPTTHDICVHCCPSKSTRYLYCTTLGPSSLCLSLYSQQCNLSVLVMLISVTVFCLHSVMLFCNHHPSLCTLSGLLVRWSWWQSSDSFFGPLFSCVHRTHVLGRWFTKVICSCVLLWFFILFSILCVSLLFSCVHVCLPCTLLCTVGGAIPLCWWHSFLSLSFVYILSCL